MYLRPFVSKRRKYYINIECCLVPFQDFTVVVQCVLLLCKLPSTLVWDYCSCSGLCAQTSVLLSKMSDFHKLCTLMVSSTAAALMF